jgi:hypothetical protein
LNNAHGSRRPERAGASGTATADNLLALSARLGYAGVGFGPHPCGGVVMRFVLCAVLALACSVATGEPIRITSAIANYDTQSDAIDIGLTFSRPYDAANDFTFNLSYVVGVPRPFEISFLLQLRGDGPDSFAIETKLLNAVPPVTFGLSAFDVPFSDDRMSFRAVIPNAREIMQRDDLANIPIRMSATVVDEHGNRTPFRSWATVNDPRYLHQVPEPSSIAIAGIGGLLIGLHLVRAPCFRQRLRKRHPTREPIVVRA